MMKPRVFFRLQLWLALLLISGGIIELSARMYLRFFASRDHVLLYASLPQLARRPDFKPKFSPHPYLGYMPAKNYRRGANRHNGLGFRGAEINEKKPASHIRIACLGGSTVYGDGVEDYRQSFPYLLETYFKQRGRDRIQVINAGVPGYSSFESLINFEFRVAELDVDILLVYQGINDVYPRLVWPPSAYRGDNTGFRAGGGFGEAPYFWEHSTLIRMLLIRSGRLQSPASLARALGSPPSSALLPSFQRQRARGTYPRGVFKTTPMARVLAENEPRYFERNLRHLIAVARVHGIRVVLVSFAYSDLFPEQVEIGDPQIRGAIDESNALLIELAVAENCLSYDFQKEFPKDRAMFTDGYHFTFEGNQKRARLIGDFLRENLLSIEFN